VNFSDAALNRQQTYNGNRYPSINSYANSVVSRMEGIDPNEQRRTAGSGSFPGSNGSNQRPPERTGSGSFPGSNGSNQMPADVRASIIARATPKRRGSAEETGSLSDLDRERDMGPGQYSVYENTGWDMASFIKQQTLEAGGADVDAFSFANRAMDFYTLLGER